MQCEAHVENIRDPGIADGDDFGPFGRRVRCECERICRWMRDAEDGQIRISVHGYDLRGVINFSIEDIDVETGTPFDHMGIGDHEAAGIHEKSASQGEGMSGLVGPDDEHGRRFGVAEDVLSRARVGGLRDSQEKARCNQRLIHGMGKV
jgi:hypothetical protein